MYLKNIIENKSNFQQSFIFFHWSLKEKGDSIVWDSNKITLRNEMRN